MSIEDLFNKEEDLKFIKCSDNMVLEKIREECEKNKNEVIQRFKEFKNKDNLMNYLNELVSEVIFNEDRTLEIRFNFKLN